METLKNKYTWSYLRVWSRERERYGYRLKKSLYGLKQSPRAWFNRFANAVRWLGCTNARIDHTLFYRHKESKKQSSSSMSMTSFSHAMIKMRWCRLKENLQEFEMDLGNPRYLLGMEMTRKKTEISVAQRKYVIDLLKEIERLGCNQLIHQWIQK